MKVVFMGTPDFAVASLDAIHKSGHEVVGVVTNIDKKSGRGQKVSVSAVKTYAVENDLKLLQPEKFKNEDFLTELAALEADIFVVVAFRMLPEVVWAMPPKGTINLHGSILPNYRGAAPLNWAIINGDQETGVSTFFIEKEIDTGEVIDIAKLPIGENMTAGELHDQMMLLGAKTLIGTLDKIESGAANGIPQNQLIKGNEKPAPKIFKETCQIDWNESAQKIHNKVRGLSPYPVAWSNFTMKGKTVVAKIYETRIAEDKLESGEIITDNKTFLTVGCKEGSVSILSLQLPGKKRVDIKSFLNGFKLEEGSDCFA
ncbi:MAG: methionyl-tRNA formyltransferase [Flavobacteriales bacterium]|jgi:methionyl-tRNA formyltransferase|nr:methionyl-tRNA formyltransferase [Flavobacteriales bacterium]